MSRQKHYRKSKYDKDPGNEEMVAVVVITIVVCLLAALAELAKQAS